MKPVLLDVTKSHTECPLFAGIYQQQATGQAKDEICGRIGLARSAFTQLKATLWSRRKISLKTNGRIYEALVRTVLLYGGETWPVHVEDLRRLEVLDNDCLRCIL